MNKNFVGRCVDLLRTSRERLSKSYSVSINRTLHLAGVSGAGDILLGLGKILSGAVSLSIFVCVNGGYTLGMVVARYCALVGFLRAKNVKEQCRYYRWPGTILIIASLLYVSYSGWAYFYPKYTAYPKSIALAIATVTFVEIGLNIHGVLINRKNKTPLLHAIKTINLAASLISLVLTQSALLSIAQGEYHNPSVNALLGVLMGICAALLGVFMLWRVGRIEATLWEEK